MAEAGGEVVGSNCLYEGEAIAGVGPMAVDPSVRNRGTGRILMDAVIERARSRGVAGIRLAQAAYHNRSLSLYTAPGFDVREQRSRARGAWVRSRS